MNINTRLNSANAVEILALGPCFLATRVFLLPVRNSRRPSENIRIDQSRCATACACWPAVIGPTRRHARFILIVHIALGADLPATGRQQGTRDLLCSCFWARTGHPARSR